MIVFTGITSQQQQCILNRTDSSKITVVTIKCGNYFWTEEVVSVEKKILLSISSFLPTFTAVVQLLLLLISRSETFKCVCIVHIFVYIEQSRVVQMIEKIIFCRSPTAAQHHFVSSTKFYSTSMIQPYLSVDQIKVRKVEGIITTAALAALSVLVLSFRHLVKKM